MNTKLNKSFGSYLRRREKKLIKRSRLIASDVDTDKLLIKARRTSAKANDYIFVA